MKIVCLFSGLAVIVCAGCNREKERNLEILEKAVYDALDRSDILITTGGLGPTGDDLTKETVAAAAGWMQMDWSGVFS